MINTNSSPLVWSILDKISLKFLFSNIHKISDTNLRSNIWISIEGLVDLAYLQIQDYAEFVATNILSEPSNKILRRIIERAPKLISNILSDY